MKLVAELKMLRLLQNSVNSKTKKVNQLPESSKERKSLAAKTAKKQARVEDLTRKLARKLQKEEDHQAEHDREGRR